ncbi:hypothetical protein FRC01_005540 [Tulasnella sp. 417]|nr:hypothetical protein FRC01_005540 [Tulasnella sp. 417]
MLPHTNVSTLARQINLLHLETFSLALDDMNNTNIVFDYINAPRCSRLSIFLEGILDIGGRAAHLAVTWLARMRTPISSLTSTTFAMTNTEVTLSTTFNDVHEVYSVSFRSYSGEENLARILGGVNRVAKEHLNATESHFKVDDKAFSLLMHRGVVDQLRQLPAVTTIEIGDPSSEGDGLAYYNYPIQFTLPPFPELRLFRIYNQPVERVFALLKAIFAAPIAAVEDRTIHVEIHLRVNLEPGELDSTVAQLKEIVGANCTASFVCTPRFEKWEG